MKLITRDTDYALRALLFIAKNKNRLVSVTELVKVLKMPRPFLRKLMQVLNKNRILKSYKGFSGGFELAVGPDKIFLTDLMKIFQGELVLNECNFKKKDCPNKPACGLRKKIIAIEKLVLSQLEPITIGSLL